jgi:hypothetical protein
MDHEGPTALADGSWEEAGARRIASMLLRYINKRGEGEMRVRCRREGEAHELLASAAEPSTVDACRI